jgi:hypothetical protein
MDLASERDKKHLVNKSEPANKWIFNGGLL